MTIESRKVPKGTHLADQIYMRGTFDAQNNNGYRFCRLIIERKSFAKKEKILKHGTFFY